MFSPSGLSRAGFIYLAAKIFFMPGQVGYYNHFGEKYEKRILSCPEPELWTTDYQTKGRIYQEIKERVEQQYHLISTYFDTAVPVLDIGCGFGRQAVLLAKKGYTVTGTDTSDVFIDIAQKLFTHHALKGNFICTDIISEKKLTGSYKQILLLDVLEHIKPFQRRRLLTCLYDLAAPGALLIISLPHVKQRITSQLNNSLRRKITQHIPYFLKREEHPYPIPQKKNIARLTKGLFQPESFASSTATDYYVFRKNPS